MLKNQQNKSMLLSLLLLQNTGYQRIPWHWMHCKRGGKDAVLTESNCGANEKRNCPERRIRHTPFRRTEWSFLPECRFPQKRNNFRDALWHGVGIPGICPEWKNEGHSKRDATLADRRFLPAFHMNKRTWFAIQLDGGVETAEILRLTGGSRDQAVKKWSPV